jgi:hypothetical protein
MTSSATARAAAPMPAVGRAAGRPRPPAPRRTLPRALGLVLVLLLASLRPATAQDTPPGAVRMPPELEGVFRQILDRSPTFRAQYEHLAAARGVRVDVVLVSWLPGDRHAQTVMRPAAPAGFDAWVEISGPRRLDEYAELLAHEFEHVREQLEGVDLGTLCRQHLAGVSRLADGSYETERAIRAGRQASRELLSARPGPERGERVARYAAESVRQKR